MIPARQQLSHKRIYETAPSGTAMLMARIPLTPACSITSIAAADHDE
jgi:hypothetical protein